MYAICMYDLKKRSKKHVESLDKISAFVVQPLPRKQVVETKENVKMLSGVEDLTDSQANTWVDSLIVSPIPMGKPVPHRPVTRSISNSPTKPTSNSRPWPSESPSQPKSISPHKPTTKGSPNSQLKQKAKSLDYLPVSPPPLTHAKFAWTKPSDVPI